MKLTPPPGDKITIEQGRPRVGDRPIIPFIEGDGTGPDIWRAASLVFNAAVEKAYGGKRRVQFFEVMTYVGHGLLVLRERGRRSRRLRLWRSRTP